MKLQGDVLLTRIERRDLRAPSRQIAPHLLPPLWRIAVDDAQWVIAIADNQDYLHKIGMAGDISDGVFSTIAVEGLQAGFRLGRLREMTQVVTAIGLDTLPTTEPPLFEPES